jgi:hypothetical protein
MIHAGHLPARRPSPSRTRSTAGYRGEARSGRYARDQRAGHVLVQVSPQDAHETGLQGSARARRHGRGPPEAMTYKEPPGQSHADERRHGQLRLAEGSESLRARGERAAEAGFGCGLSYVGTCPSPATPGPRCHRVAQPRTRRRREADRRAIDAFAEGHERARLLAVGQEEAIRREFIDDLLSGRRAVVLRPTGIRGHRRGTGCPSGALTRAPAGRPLLRREALNALDPAPRTVIESVDTTDTSLPGCRLQDLQPAVTPPDMESWQWAGPRRREDLPTLASSQHTPTEWA